MSDTFDPIAFLSAVYGDGDGDGDLADEFVEWYEPGKWASDEQACAAFIAAMFAQRMALSDSHLADAVNFGIKAVELKADCAMLRAALSEAADDIADWGAYAGSYFQEKHGLTGCVAKYRAIVGDAK